MICFGRKGVTFILTLSINFCKNRSFFFVTTVVVKFVCFYSYSTASARPGHTMANLSALPDLSTVDIQAIQDSGPVHPPILLPPLTTIAENWDSVELCSRNLTTNEESGSDDDEEDSEEEDHSHSSTPGKIQDRNSHRTSCSSSSTPDSETDSSDSEQSDATSDSAGSSSSSSDSDSDSGSSCASSLSGKSKTKYKAANTQHDKTSFSVREANYEKGRVTLRLSTLQFDRKQEVNNGYPNRTAKLPKIESIGTTDVKSCKSNVQTSLCGNLDRIHDSEHDVPKSKGQVIFFLFFHQIACKFYYKYICLLFIILETRYSCQADETITTKAKSRACKSEHFETSKEY